jgi:hypothetical protein
MCIGHRLCMEDVENLGFEIFPEIYDYSYDTELKDTRSIVP